MDTTMLSEEDSDILEEIKSIADSLNSEEEERPERPKQFLQVVFYIDSLERRLKGRENTLAAVCGGML